MSQDTPWRARPGPAAPSRVTDTAWQAVSGIANVVRRRFRAHVTVPLAESVPMVLYIEEGAIGRQLQQDQETRIVEVFGAGSWLCTTDSAGNCQGAEWSLLTLDRTAVLQMPLAAFQLACATDDRLSGQVAASRERRQQALLSRLVTLLERSATRRVARTLLYLADAMGEACPLGTGVRLTLPQHVIAATVDLARQTTNRELRRLHKSRALHIERGMVCVVDRQMLTDVAEGRLRVIPAERPAACRLRHPEMALDCAPIALRRG